MALRVEKTGEPNLRLYGDTGKPQAVLMMHKKAGPGLYLFNDAGRALSALYLRPDSSPTLSMRDPVDGSMRVMLENQHGKGPALTLFRDSQSIGMRAAVTSDTGAALSLCDPGNNPRAVVAADPSGQPGLYLLDQRHKARLVAAYREERAGLGVFGANGERQWSAPEGSAPSAPALPGPAAPGGLDLDDLLQGMSR